MSFDLLDTAGGRLVIRRPDGATYFDSNWRVPAQLGQITVTRRVAISAIPGEQIQAVNGSSGVRWRYFLGATNRRTIDVDLGAVPGGVRPNYLLANVKGNRIVRPGNDSSGVYQGVLYNMSLQCLFPQNVWLPLNASSLWIERMDGGSNDRDVMQRIGTLLVTGTVPRFTWRITESARTFKTNDFGTQIRGGSSTDYNFTFQIGWGVYDLGG